MKFVAYGLEGTLWLLTAAITLTLEVLHVDSLSLGLFHFQGKDTHSISKGRALLTGFSTAYGMSVYSYVVGHPLLD